MRKYARATDDDIARMETIRSNLRASVFELAIDIDISYTALRNFLMGFNINPSTYEKCVKFMKGTGKYERLQTI